MSAIPLSPATIHDLAGRAAVPGYDRTGLQVGIVHFGAGAFHRSHQAMYLDRLMSAGQARDWAICAVDVLATDRPKGAAFRSQDGLYTLLVKQPDGTVAPRVIGSLTEYLFAPDEPGRVLDRLTDPRTRIVSLTITEGGYNLQPGTGEFDAASPGVQHDLMPGALPATVFGFIVAALRRRRARGVLPFTVMSCDNIEGNGNVARSVLGAFADLAEPGLGDWLRGAVAFPNSMVDRITPVTTPADVARLAGEFGVADAWPVVCEPYVQWVLEDDFPAGRPRWQDCGVQLVTDVRPYELMKLRLLNAGHQALAYPAALAGYRYVDEAAADPVIAAFVLDYLQLEARPTVPDVPGVDLDDYVTELLARFGNPAIRDTLARLCAGGSDKIPKWVLPVVRQNLAAGRPVALAATLIASWARYAEGLDETGQPIEVVDALRDELASRARRQADDSLSFVANERVFGDLARQPAFAEPYSRALDSLRRLGALQTLAQVSR
ncbi:MAG: mannitol dehydrogenase family protein [Streptosporangiaceae bacterium]